MKRTISEIVRFVSVRAFLKEKDHYWDMALSRGHVKWSALAMASLVDVSAMKKEESNDWDVTSF